MDYINVRTLHITCATLSIGLFTLRGVLELSHYNWRRFVPLRVAPHVIDTVLLGSAITLAYWSQQYPIAQGWLSAKVIALVTYIVLGKLALGRKTNDVTKLIAFIAALTAVAYIVGVAQTRSPTLGTF